MNDCVFCKIINKQIPATIHLESDEVIAFDSIDPVADTHILIVPKKHIDSFTTAGVEDVSAFLGLVAVAQELVSEKGIGSGYKLVINGGRYQTVPHLHLHLLGGKFKDNNGLIEEGL